LDPTIHVLELQTPNMRLWAPWVLVYFHRFKGMDLKLTKQSHRCGAVLVVSMMGSYKKKYCIRSKDMRTEFQTQYKGHSQSSDYKMYKLSGKVSQPVYPAALQLVCTGKAHG
jgi:hypothetical protein